MPERFEDKVSRKWKELRMNAMKIIFKWAIEQYDKLHDGAFLAFSWGIDEVTDYHVIAERSYPDHNVYGTKVTWYEEGAAEGRLIDADDLAIHKFAGVEHEISITDGGACYRRGWNDAIEAIMDNAETIIGGE